MMVGRHSHTGPIGDVQLRHDRGLVSFSGSEEPQMKWTEQRGPDTIIGESQDYSKGVLATVAAGGGTSVGGIAFTATPVFSNARSISDYEDVFGHAGGCVGAGVIGCAEDQRGQAKDGTPVEVVATGAGIGFQPSWVGIPIPAEFHGLASNTWRILSWR